MAKKRHWDNTLNNQKIVREQLLCDNGDCNKQAVWEAYLDSLVFCLAHKKEWIRNTVGYEREL